MSAPSSSVSGGDRTLPRGALAGAAILVVLSLTLTGLARLTGYRPAAPPPSTVVERYALRFEDRSDGSVLVFSGDQQVDTLAPGTNGFVRGVLRGLVRERRADHVGEAPPFLLTRWADGRLSLDDPSTGRHVDLEVFGPTNAAAFAAILVVSGQSKDNP